MNARIELRQRGGERAIELAGAEERFEVSACEGHIVFAFWSPYQRSIRQARGGIK